jgi:hypothetical protein
VNGNGRKTTLLKRSGYRPGVGQSISCCLRRDWTV